MEANKTICKVCKEIKLKIYSGRYPNGDKCFKDDKGGQWNGKTCANCHAAKQKSLMKDKRAKKDIIE